MRHRSALAPRRAHAGAVALLAAATLTLSALAAPAAGAAQLVGGREQAAIARAFRGASSHAHLAIVSIRASTVAPSWSIVEAVSTRAAGPRASSATALAIHTAYYHRSGGRERSGTPPPAVLIDLARPFEVAVVYAGSGSESIAYQQVYRSNCAGAGGYTVSESDAVSPMTWSVRYVVDLDDLKAVAGDGSSATVVPTISLDAGGSSLNATERISQTTVDAGCNASASTSRCTETFGLAGPPAVSFSATAGLEIGIPMRPRSSGNCNPAGYTLGPSLFDLGATTALIPGLDLLGGALPARPYAPVAVAWPAGAATTAQGFASSPCQEDTAACIDTLSWHGTVTVQPLG